jgi:hypothetical protein
VVDFIRTSSGEIAVPATRLFHAAQPGELVSLDTFYIGQLTGVGKVKPAPS